jgi:hypothetical protein
MMRLDSLPLQTEHDDRRHGHGPSNRGTGPNPRARERRALMGPPGFTMDTPDVVGLWKGSVISRD